MAIHKNPATIDDLLKVLLSFKEKFGNIPVIMSLDCEGNEYSDVLDVLYAQEEDIEYIFDCYSPMPGKPSITDETKTCLILQPAR